MPFVIEPDFMNYVEGYQPRDENGAIIIGNLGPIWADPNGDPITDPIAFPHIQLPPTFLTEFGQPKYVRLVGFSEAMARANVAIKDLAKGYVVDAAGAHINITRKTIEAINPGGATLPGWLRVPFTADDFQNFAIAQLRDAARGKLQRVDRAAMCIVYLGEYLNAMGSPVADEVARLVHIRPVTYFVEGFDTSFRQSQTYADNDFEHEIVRATGQSIKTIAEMSDGVTFVTRKTADLVTRFLHKRYPSTAGRIFVRCGATRTRGGTRMIKASQSEAILYREDEYHSPASWAATAAAEQARQAGETTPRPHP